jgi:hypothetical protein
MAMETPDATLRPDAKSIWMCLSDEAWQDHLAQTCGRLLRESGAQYIRLDELGELFETCHNPAHHHASPYDLVPCKLELLRKVRAAMDAVDPDSMLFTEGGNMTPQGCIQKPSGLRVFIPFGKQQSQVVLRFKEQDFCLLWTGGGAFQGGSVEPLGLFEVSGVFEQIREAQSCFEGDGVSGAKTPDFVLQAEEEKLFSKRTVMRCLSQKSSQRLREVFHPRGSRSLLAPSFPRRLVLLSRVCCF